MNRCDVCGKYRKHFELVCMESEDWHEEWEECFYCMSESDFDFYIGLISTFPEASLIKQKRDLKKKKRDDK